MYEKLTRLKHLRDAMTETMGQITGVACAAAEAIEEVAANAVTMDQVQEAIWSAAAGATVPPDPVAVYRAERPGDWLPIPEPADHEIYLLVHIPDGLSSLLAFTVTCTGMYTVQLLSAAGNMLIPTSSTNAASGTVYEEELSADAFGSLTSNGMKQVLVKISGEDILSWAPAVHSKKTSPSNFASWNIVEIQGRLPAGTSVKPANLFGLRYFALYGPNQISDMTSAFAECRALSAVLRLDTGNVQNMNMMFYNCSSLTALPPLVTDAAVNMGSMFYGCGALMAVPQMNTARVSDMSSMFNNCCALTVLPPMDTGLVSDMSRMFSNCKALTAVRGLNICQAGSVGAMFGSCSSLAALRLVPVSGSFTVGNLSLSGCSLGHDAIVTLFEELPVLSATKTLTLTGNPGVLELTEDEKAVAAAKNWILKL